MLNRITGGLLFLQLSYLALFLALASINLTTHGAVFSAFTWVRTVFNLNNTFVKLSDYIYYPMIFSALLNVALMLIFFWIILRRRYTPSLSCDFFSLLNSTYIAASGWILFAAFTGFIRR